MIDLIKEKIKEFNFVAFLITLEILILGFTFIYNLKQVNIEERNELIEKRKIINTIYDRDFESYEEWLYYENHERIKND